MLLKTQNQNDQHKHTVTNTNTTIPWKLRIKANANRFNFDLNLKFSSPPLPLPSQFNLRHCNLSFALDLRPSKTTLKSKLQRIFQKLRRTRRSNKRHCLNHGLMNRVWVVLVAALLVSSFEYPFRRVLGFDEAAVFKLLRKAWYFAANLS